MKGLLLSKGRRWGKTVLARKGNTSRICKTVVHRSSNHCGWEWQRGGEENLEPLTLGSLGEKDRHLRQEKGEVTEIFSAAEQQLRMLSLLSQNILSPRVEDGGENRAWGKTKKGEQQNGSHEDDHYKTVITISKGSPPPEKNRTLKHPQDSRTQQIEEKRL